MESSAVMEVLVNPPKLDTLDDMKLWAAGIDARENAHWKEQHQKNRHITQEVSDMNTRLRSIEHKVLFYCGAAAAVGGMIGAAMPYLLGR